MTDWLALEEKTTDASKSMTDALQKSDKIATQELISSLSDDENVLEANFIDK